jgi:hypothetical protein
MIGFRALVALSAAVLTIFAIPAVAQSAGASRRKPVPGQVQAEVQQKKPAGRKVVRLEEMRVEGRIQKPQAMFVMPRASVSSGEPDRAESFLPQVKSAVEKDPF